MLGLRKILDKYGATMKSWDYEDKIKEFMKGNTMTLNEFKQWLRGFSESFTGSHPNSNEWKRIQDELAKVKENHYPSPYIPSPTIAPPTWFAQQYPPGVRGPSTPIPTNTPVCGGTQATSPKDMSSPFKES